MCLILSVVPISNSLCEKMSLKSYSKSLAAVCVFWAHPLIPCSSNCFKKSSFVASGPSLGFSFALGTAFAGSTWPTVAPLLNITDLVLEVFFNTQVTLQDPVFNGP